jgi:hypothetical protein
MPQSPWSTFLRPGENSRAGLAKMATTVAFKSLAGYALARQGFIRTLIYLRKS